MTISHQIIIHTAPQVITDAFMQSQHTAVWWQGCRAFFDLENKTFSWVWHNNDGAILYLTHGQILDYAAGVFLHLHQIWQYDHEQTHPIGPVDLLIEITPQVNDCLLVVKSSGFKTDDEQWRQNADAVNKGWGEVLPELKRYLEKV